VSAHWLRSLEKHNIEATKLGKLARSTAILRDYVVSSACLCAFPDALGTWYCSH